MIRQAELNDVPSLKTLFVQLGYQTQEEKLKRHLTELDSNMTVLVAESEGNVRGVIVVNVITPIHENGLWALISALVIDESARGAGLGQQLLMAAEHIAVEQSCSQIELSSSVKRVRAHKFYEDNGYQEVRKRFIKLLPDLPLV